MAFVDSTITKNYPLTQILMLIIWEVYKTNTNY